MQKPTKEYLQELFNYIDGNLHHKKRRPGVQVGTRAGTFDKDGYLVIHLNKKKYRAHHLVWVYHYDIFPKMIDIVLLKSGMYPDRIRTLWRWDTMGYSRKVTPRHSPGPKTRQYPEVGRDVPRSAFRGNSG